VKVNDFLYIHFSKTITSTVLKPVTVI